MSEEKVRLLYIDDEKENLIGFKYMFRSVYDLSLAQSAAEALGLLEDNRYDVIISDQRMPDMTGVEFFQKILPDHPHTARMILTGYSDFDAIIDAVNKGKIYYYFRKPWNESEVKLVVANAVEALRLEQEVRTNERRFRDIAESSGDWIWETDAHWRYTYASGNVKAMLGYEPAELLGKTPFDLMPEDQVENLKTLFLALSTGQEPIRDLEHTYLSADGSERVVLTNGVPIRDADQGYRGVDKDVTEHKHLEEQLRQTEKMNAIGQLAGGIAHDFNNQLEGIMGYAELLKTKLDDPKLKRFAGNIVKAAERSAGLTAGLLAFGRKSKAVSAPVELNSLLHEIAGLLKRSVHRNIAVRLDLTADNATVSGDSAQLQNAFLNLAINARDAMPQGGEIVLGSKIVTLDETFFDESGETVTPGWYVVVSVSDTGCGISEDSCARIFEPFYTTKGEGEGTGLGLVGVHSTVLSHGGMIRFQSEVGKGTSFQVYLPLVEVARNAPQAEAAVAPARETAHILFADDEEILREAAADTLTELGYSVQLCGDGEEAVEYYRESWRDVDLVVLDMSMPVMNGKAAFTAMRRINPDVRVIIASGFSDSEVQSVVDEGVTFLGKPYRISEFAARIAEALKRESAKK